MCSREGRHIGETRWRAGKSQLERPSLLLRLDCFNGGGVGVELKVLSLGVTGMGSWDPDWRFIVTPLMILLPLQNRMERGRNEPA